MNDEDVGGQEPDLSVWMDWLGLYLDSLSTKLTSRERHRLASALEHAGEPISTATLPSALAAKAEPLFAFISTAAAPRHELLVKEARMRLRGAPEPELVRRVRPGGRPLTESR
jgi:hypothetical protein